MSGYRKYVLIPYSKYVRKIEPIVDSIEEKKKDYVGDKDPFRIPKSIGDINYEGTCSGEIYGSNTPLETDNDDNQGQQQQQRGERQQATQDQHNENTRAEHMEVEENERVQTRHPKPPKRIKKSKTKNAAATNAASDENVVSDGNSITAETSLEINPNIHADKRQNSDQHTEVNNLDVNGDRNKTSFDNETKPDVKSEPSEGDDKSIEQNELRDVNQSPDSINLDDLETQSVSKPKKDQDSKIKTSAESKLKDSTSEKIAKTETRKSNRISKYKVDPDYVYWLEIDKPRRTVKKSDIVDGD